MNKLYQELANPNQNQMSNNTFNNSVNHTNHVNSVNPEQLLMNMAKQNPNVQKVLNMIRTSGKTPKELFYEMAAQKGVDPNQILGMLR